MIRFGILILAFLLPFQASASFSETSRRYLSPRDLFNVLGQKFPIMNSEKVLTLKPTCWKIGSNINLIGAVNPAVGSPAAELPVTGFVRWLGTCGGNLVKLQFEDLARRQTDENLWKQFFPENFRAKYASTFQTAKWNSLPEETRDEVLRYQIEMMIGPENVIKDLGFAGSTSDLLKVLKAATAVGGTISEAAQLSMVALVLREEFISY